MQQSFVTTLAYEQTNEQTNVQTQSHWWQSRKITNCSCQGHYPECVHILTDSITFQVTVSPDIFLPALYRHFCVSPPKLCVQCSLWFHYSYMTFIIKCTSYCIPRRAIYLVWWTCSLYSFCRETGDHLKMIDQANAYRYVELCTDSVGNDSCSAFSSAAWWLTVCLHYVQLYKASRGPQSDIGIPAEWSIPSGGDGESLRCSCLLQQPIWSEW